MIFFYYILVWILWLFATIPLFILSFIKNKYKNALKARFFLYKNLHQEKAQVHFHTCSLGETRSIKDLAKHFDSRISVITQTGFDEAKSFCRKLNFLAFEAFIPFWLKSCKVLVIFEAEYWLMLIFMAKLKGAKVLLISARISDKSYKSYKHFAFFYRYVFNFIDEVFAQSQKDKERLLELGAKNIQICGNIKANLEIKTNRNLKKLKDFKLIILASTHKGEEELLLSNLHLEKDEKLIIAPRHPERFLEVENLLKEQNVTFEKFTSLNLELNDFQREFKSQILLLDSLGELVNFYAISDIVVLGGSFIEGIGGHNPIEVAHFDNVLISGKYIHNQENLFQKVENVVFCENKELGVKIHSESQKVKIKEKQDLSIIIQAIKEGINARKSI